MTDSDSSTIISVSMKESFLEELDNFIDDNEFRGRSQAVREGLHLLFSQHEDLQQQSGRVVATLLVVHEVLASHGVLDLHHAYEDVIRTHLHHCVNDDICVEMYVMDGDARTVARFTRAAQSQNDVLGAHVNILSQREYEKSNKD